jgi:two-component system sensor histidine kinase KdpD
MQRQAWVQRPTKIRWRAVGAAIALPLLVTAVASASDLGPFGPPSLYLLAVVAAAAVGGVGSGLGAAVISFVGLNFYFTAPRHTLRVSKPQDVVALLVFLVVATIVGALFARALAERERAERQEGELRLLNRLATRLLSSELSAASVEGFAQAVADQLRLAICAVELTDDPGLSTAEAGWIEADNDSAVALNVPIDSGAVTLGTMHVQRTRGAAGFTVADHRLLQALTGLLGLAIERQRLDAEARAARSDAEVSDIRAALFSSVTHDFRTPLASIKAGITGLASTDVALGPDERRELLATVVEETDRLNRLVDNVLNLARARAGEIVVEKELTPFDDVVETVLARLQIALAPFRLVAQIRDDLPAVWVDPVQMDQALSNIIENAIRHSPPGGTITVAVTGWRGGIHVRVADQGPGIPEEDRKLVFEPFYRGHADPQRQGSGLGLSIARAVVTAHGGKIWIEGVVGTGAAVVIELPVGEPMGAS